MSDLVCVPRADLVKVVEIARVQVGTGDPAVRALSEALAHGGRTAAVPPPGEPPYGYRWEGAMLERVASEQQRIEAMRSYRRAGMSFRQVATLLNMDNIPSPRGALWSGESVRRILQRDRGEQ